jgi:hypothetical protein
MPPVAKIKRLTGWTALLLLASSLACDSDNVSGPEQDVLPPLPRSTFHALSPADREEWSSDDEGARTAREDVPGFAGLMKDKDGGYTMWLADTAELLRKRQTAESRLGGGAGEPVIRRIKRVRFNFDQLKGVRDVIRQNGLDGARWDRMGIDVRTNRMNILASSRADEKLVRRALRRLRIPPAMVAVAAPGDLYTVSSLEGSDIVCVICDDTCVSCTEFPPDPPPVEDTSPIVTAPSPDVLTYSQTCVGLQCSQYRLWGGLGIRFASPRAGYDRECTMTPASLATGSTVFIGFLTASHCSTTAQGTLDGTTFRQGPSWSVGVKLRDSPLRRTTRCYPGNTCTYADAQFVEVYSNVPTSQGWVASTIYTDAFLSDSLAAPLVSRLDGTVMSYDRDIPLVLLQVGERIYKTGAVTGSTTGIVTKLCYDLVNGYLADGTPVEIDCQVEVKAEGNQSYPVAREGDSGAPVYSFVSDHVTAVQEGITTARSVNGTMYFTPWQAIRTVLADPRSSSSLQSTCLGYILLYACSR